ncbi:hypothetical protein B0H12DRAFT_342717 [Mycena haematopus]|nr:hypothetical protein B0H12DRAFT_342717 [Mycena haematopus]
MNCRLYALDTPPSTSSSFSISNNVFGREPDRHSGETTENEATPVSPDIKATPRQPLGNNSRESVHPSTSFESGAKGGFEPKPSPQSNRAKAVPAGTLDPKALERWFHTGVYEAGEDSDHRT